jgi:hypothetical protein
MVPSVAVDISRMLLGYETRSVGPCGAAEIEPTASSPNSAQRTLIHDDRGARMPRTAVSAGMRLTFRFWGI